MTMTAEINIKRIGNGGAVVFQLLGVEHAVNFDERLEKHARNKRIQTVQHRRRHGDMAQKYRQNAFLPLIVSSRDIMQLR